MTELPAATGPILSARDLNAWYDESHVLHGLNFDLQRGQVVTLLGHNGAGKTTALRAIMGILKRCTGSIRFEGKELLGERPDWIARRGIAYCPEERGIFSRLTVEENLELPPVIKRGGMSDKEIFTLFPNLLERRKSQGTKLSGGEQQMLAIGRILRSGAKLLLLDEPTEGLAPIIVKQIRQLILLLKEKGYTILLVEQNAHFASKVADCHYIVENGSVVDMITNVDMDRKKQQISDYLSI